MLVHEIGSPEWRERGPSQHLSWNELRCRDGTDYPLEWADRAITVAREFEWIRHLCGGGPIQVGSAYRTPLWNRKKRGARKSQHVSGKALDLYPPNGYDVVSLLAIVVGRAKVVGSTIRGVGKYPWGVHFDVRPGNRLARWNGTRAYAEVA